MDEPQPIDEVEARRAERRERDRRYRELHPDRMKAATLKWRAKNADKVLAQGRRRTAEGRAYHQRYPDRAKEDRDAWRAANPDKVREDVKAWRAANPDKALVYTRRWWASHPEARAKKLAANRTWAAENRDKVNEGKRRWHAADRRRQFAATANLRARRCGVPERLDWRLVPQPAPCHYCGVACTSWDHVVPLSRGGPNTVENLVPCCKPCNTSKHNRTPEEWTA